MTDTTTTAAADPVAVRALPPRAAAAAQPDHQGRHLRRGHAPGRGDPGADRLPRRGRPGRRGADHRGLLRRVDGRPGQQRHAGVHRGRSSPTSSGSPTPCTPRARWSRPSSATPASSPRTSRRSTRRWRRRPASARRRWAGSRRRRPRSSTRSSPTSSAPPGWRSRPASTRSRSTSATTTCSARSSAPTSTSATTSSAAASRTAPASPGGSSRRSAGSADGQVAVLAKFNMADGVDEGLWLDESLPMAQLLEADGHLDAIELTGGSSLLNGMYFFRGDVPMKEFAAAQGPIVGLGLRAVRPPDLPRATRTRRPSSCPFARQFREALVDAARSCSAASTSWPPSRPRWARASSSSPWPGPCSASPTWSTRWRRGRRDRRALRPLQQVPADHLHGHPLRPRHLIATRGPPASSSGGRAGGFSSGHAAAGS